MERGGKKDAVVASELFTHPLYKCGTTAHVELLGNLRLILESSLPGNIHLAEYLYFEARTRPTNPRIQVSFFSFFALGVSSQQ